MINKHSDGRCVNITWAELSSRMVNRLTVRYTNIYFFINLRFQRWQESYENPNNLSSSNRNT